MKKTITLYDGERHIHLFKIGAAELDIPELPDGIKVLGRGEHVVLPSSVGNTKSRLRFVAERGPTEIELAAAPPKWLRLTSDLGVLCRGPADRTTSATRETGWADFHDKMSQKYSDAGSSCLLPIQDRL